MSRILRADVISGLVVVVVGTAFAAYCYQNYSFGTLRRVGPGMFPVLVGVAMLVCGLICLIQALADKEGEAPSVEMRPLVFVVASLAAFGLLITSAGIMPAVFVLTIVSGFAKKNPNLGKLVLLAVALSGFAALLFGLLLGSSSAIIAWPFGT